MTQLKKVVDPFGEVNVFPRPDGKVHVVATILMEPHKEGAQTGIALDGSGSMHRLYGIDDGSGAVSSIFAPPRLENQVTKVAQKLCAYLARKIDADGGTTCIYWATGENGSQIEEVGDFTADQAERHTFGPPQDFGTGTQLLPAVRYFVDRFRTAPWGFFVFITDGELHDLDAVKEYSVRLAREIAARRRNPLKFVLIGLGPDVNEAQMVELDDLEAPVDLWDHKLASELRVLQQIFAEVVDKNARVANHGRLLDARGQVVKDFSDTGLPAYLEFDVPAGSAYFTLEVNGQRIHQGLSDQAQVPQATRVTPPLPTSTSAQTATPAPQPPASKPTQPTPTKPAVEEEDAEWKHIDLVMRDPNDPVDVDLKKHD